MYSQTKNTKNNNCKLDSFFQDSHFLRFLLFDKYVTSEPLPLLKNHTNDIIELIDLIQKKWDIHLIGKDIENLLKNQTIDLMNMERKEVESFVDSDYTLCFFNEKSTLFALLHDDNQKQLIVFKSNAQKDQSDVYSIDSTAMKFYSCCSCLKGFDHISFKELYLFVFDCTRNTPSFDFFKDVLPFFEQTIKNQTKKDQTQIETIDLHLIKSEPYSSSGMYVEPLFMLIKYWMKHVSKEGHHKFFNVMQTMRLSAIQFILDGSLKSVCVDTEHDLEWMNMLEFRLKLIEKTNGYKQIQEKIKTEYLYNRINELKMNYYKNLNDHSVFKHMKRNATLKINTRSHVFGKLPPIPKHENQTSFIDLFLKINQENNLWKDILLMFEIVKVSTNKFEQSLFDASFEKLILRLYEHVIQWSSVNDFENHTNDFDRIYQLLKIYIKNCFETNETLIAINKAENVKKMIACIMCHVLSMYCPQDKKVTHTFESQQTIITSKNHLKMIEIIEKTKETHGSYMMQPYESVSKCEAFIKELERLQQIFSNVSDSNSESYWNNAWMFTMKQHKVLEQLVSHEDDNGLCTDDLRYFTLYLLSKLDKKREQQFPLLFCVKYFTSVMGMCDVVFSEMKDHEAFVPENEKIELSSVHPVLFSLCLNIESKQSFIFHKKNIRQIEEKHMEQNEHEKVNLIEYYNPFFYVMNNMGSLRNESLMNQSFSHQQLLPMHMFHKDLTLKKKNTFKNAFQSGKYGKSLHLFLQNVLEHVDTLKDNYLNFIGNVCVCLIHFCNDLKMETKQMIQESYNQHFNSKNQLNYNSILQIHHFLLIATNQISVIKENDSMIETWRDMMQKINESKVSKYVQYNTFTPNVPHVPPNDIEVNIWNSKSLLKFGEYCQLVSNNLMVENLISFVDVNDNTNKYLFYLFNENRNKHLLSDFEMLVNNKNELFKRDHLMELSVQYYKKDESQKNKVFDDSNFSSQMSTQVPSISITSSIQIQKNAQNESSLMVYNATYEKTNFEGNYSTNTEQSTFDSVCHNHFISCINTETYNAFMFPKSENNEWLNYVIQNEKENITRHNTHTYPDTLHVMHSKINDRSNHISTFNVLLEENDYMTNQIPHTMKTIIGHLWNHFRGEFLIWKHKNKKNHYCVEFFKREKCFIFDNESFYTINKYALIDKMNSLFSRWCDTHGRIMIFKKKCHHMLLLFLDKSYDQKIFQLFGGVLEFQMHHSASYVVEKNPLKIMLLIEYLLKQRKSSLCVPMIKQLRQCIYANMNMNGEDQTLKHVERVATKIIKGHSTDFGLRHRYFKFKLMDEIERIHQFYTFRDGKNNSVTNQSNNQTIKTTNLIDLLEQTQTSVDYILCNDPMYSLVSLLKIEQLTKLIIDAPKQLQTKNNVLTTTQTIIEKHIDILKTKYLNEWTEHIENQNTKRDYKDHKNMTMFQVQIMLQESDPDLFNYNIISMIFYFFGVCLSKKGDCAVFDEKLSDISNTRINMTAIDTHIEFYLLIETYQMKTITKESNESLNQHIDFQKVIFEKMKQSVLPTVQNNFDLFQNTSNSLDTNETLQIVRKIQRLKDVQCDNTEENMYCIVSHQKMLESFIKNKKVVDHLITQKSIKLLLLNVLYIYKIVQKIIESYQEFDYNDGYQHILNVQSKGMQMYCFYVLIGVQIKKIIHVYEQYTMNQNKSKKGNFLCNKEPNSLLIMDHINAIELEIQQTNNEENVLMRSNELYESITRLFMLFNRNMEDERDICKTLFEFAFGESSSIDQYLKINEAMQFYDNKNRFYCNSTMNGGKSSFIIPQLITLIQSLKEDSNHKHVFCASTTNTVHSMNSNMFDTLSCVLNISLKNLQIDSENQKDQLFVEQYSTMFRDYGTGNLNDENKISIWCISDQSLKCMILNDKIGIKSTQSIFNNSENTNILIVDDMDVVSDAMCSELMYASKNVSKIPWIDLCLVVMSQLIFKLVAIDPLKNSLLNKSFQLELMNNGCFKDGYFKITNNEYDIVQSSLFVDFLYEHILDGDSKQVWSTKQQFKNYIQKRRYISELEKMDNEQLNSLLDKDSDFYRRYVFFKLFNQIFPQNIKTTHVQNKMNHVIKDHRQKNETSSNQQFFDLFDEMYYSLLHFKINGFEPHQIQSYMHHLFEKSLYEKNKQHLLNLIIEKSSQNNEIKHLFSYNNGEYRKNTNIVEFEKNKYPINQIIQNHELLYFDMCKFVFKKKETHTFTHNVSFFDVVSKNIFQKVIAFVSTPYYHAPLSVDTNDRFERAKDDYQSMIEMLFHIVFYTKHGQIISNQNQIVPPKVNEIQKMDQLYDLVNQYKFSCFIDASNMLMNENIKNIAKKLLFKCKHVKGVVFFESGDPRYIQRKHKNDKEYLKSDYSEKNFIFYDTEHLYGIDCNMGRSATGLISLSSACNIESIIRSMCRLRNIRLDQNVSFIVDKTECKPNIQNNISEWVSLMLINQNNKMNATYYYSYIQSLRSIVRMYVSLMEQHKTKDVYTQNNVCLDMNQKTIELSDMERQIFSIENLFSQFKTSFQKSLFDLNHEVSNKIQQHLNNIKNQNTPVHCQMKTLTFRNLENISIQKNKFIENEKTKHAHAPLYLYEKENVKYLLDQYSKTYQSMMDHFYVSNNLFRFMKHNECKMMDVSCMIDSVDKNCVIMFTSEIKRVQKVVKNDSVLRNRFEFESTKSKFKDDSVVSKLWLIGSLICSFICGYKHTEQDEYYLFVLLDKMNEKVFLEMNMNCLFHQPLLKRLLDQSKKKRVSLKFLTQTNVSKNNGLLTPLYNTLMEKVYDDIDYHFDSHFEQIKVHSKKMIE